MQELAFKIYYKLYKTEMLRLIMLTYYFYCKTYGYSSNLWSCVSHRLCGLFFKTVEIRSFVYSKHGAVISKRKFHIRRGRVSNRGISREIAALPGWRLNVHKEGRLVVRWRNCDTIDRIAGAAAETRRYLSIVTANGSVDSVIARDSLESRSRRNTVIDYPYKPRRSYPIPALSRGSRINA